ncbi:MAG: histidine phosphatase family protein [Armatimonadota bacterium]
MPCLILVKHSAPEIVPATPARLWQLSEAGRLKCARLAEHLAAHHPDVIVSSVEPKAAETAQIVADFLGKPVETAEGLGEHDRSNIGFLTTERFEAAVGEFFQAPQRLVFGRETADQAYRRFAAAVEDILANHPGNTVTLVTHGTVIAMYVARAVPLDPFLLWKRLGTPSFVVLSLSERRVVTVVERI